MWPNSQETADLVTFTGKIVDGKNIFCAVVFRKTITDQRKNVISVQLERLLTGIAFYETG